MKKQTLNEEISRIKGMMGINEQQGFDDFDTQITPEEMTYNGDESFERAQRIASDVLSDVVNRPITNPRYSVFDDEGFDGSEIMLSFGNEEGTLYYYFDVEISSHSSSSPATYYDPAEYSDAEYVLKPKYMEVHDGTDVIYKGDDFTNIMDVKLSNGKDVEEYAYNEFDERIQIWSSENGIGDRWDTEDYRDNN